MSCMSARSLFSEFPTDRELKQSFCNYFQKNRIIIQQIYERCENMQQMVQGNFLHVSLMPVVTYFLDFQQV